MRRQVGRVIGREFVSPVVEGMDVDAIIHQIDIQDLLENHVDINEVLDKVDINKILQKVDINKLLNKVDMDKLMSNIDINAIIERSDLESIIQRSSSGFFGSFINLVRARMAMFDQWVQRFGRCSCCSKEPWLPPRPGGIDHNKTKIPWPKTASDFGVAVQFRCCGFITRTFAWMTDNLIIAFSYLLFVWIIEKIASLFNDYSTFYTDTINNARDNNNNNNNNGTDTDTTTTTIGDEANKYYYDHSLTDNEARDWNVYVFGPTLLLYEFFYSTIFIGCFGRTIGMLIFGLLVVNHDGRHVGVLQTMIRNVVTIFNIVFFGWLVGLIRRDGKNWTDLMSCTCLVYAWNSTAGIQIENTKQKGKGNNDFATSIHYNDEEYALLFDSLNNNNNNNNNSNTNKNNNIGATAGSSSKSSQNSYDEVYVDAEENYNEGFVAKQL